MATATTIDQQKPKLYRIGGKSDLLLRNATEQEREASQKAASRETGNELISNGVAWDARGVIEVDGWDCYVKD